MMLSRLLLLLTMIRSRRTMSLWLSFLVVAFAILSTASIFYYVEGKERTPPLDYGDALWFAVVSITTIGYGDYTPTTGTVRLSVLVFTILIGLSAFTIFLGLVIDAFSTALNRGRRGMLPLDLKDHILIVHMPAVRRFRQILGEIAADDCGKHRRVVLLAENLEERPEGFDQIAFVRGSPLATESYLRAAADRAAMAIVLATDYADPNSDAVVASAVVMLKKAAPNLRVVAELLDADKRELLEAARADAIVPGLEIVGNLLVQESQDIGTAEWIELVATNRRAGQIFTHAFTEDEGKLVNNYRELGVALIDHFGASLVGVRRANACHTEVFNLQPEPGDRILYLRTQRIPDVALSRFLSQSTKRVPSS